MRARAALAALALFNLQDCVVLDPLSLVQVPSEAKVGGTSAVPDIAVLNSPIELKVGNPQFYIVSLLRSDASAQNSLKGATVALFSYHCGWRFSLFCGGSGLPGRGYANAPDYSVQNARGFSVVSNTEFDDGTGWDNQVIVRAAGGIAVPRIQKERMEVAAANDNWIQISALHNGQRLRGGLRSSGGGISDYPQADSGEGQYERGERRYDLSALSDDLCFADEECFGILGRAAGVIVAVGLLLFLIATLIGDGSGRGPKQNGHHKNHDNRLICPL